jgi:hyperosmotically inducible protein
MIMPDFKNLLVIAGLSAAVAVTGLSGCASWHKRSDERSEGRATDDTRITSKVKEELQKEPVYKFSDVDVKTFNAVVQLSGFVNSEDQKRKAAELASRVEGVAQVVNNISLKPQSSTPTGRPAPSTETK